MMSWRQSSCILDFITPFITKFVRSFEGFCCKYVSDLAGDVYAFSSPYSAFADV